MTDKKWIKLGEFLKSKRIETNWSQDEMAERLMVSRQTIAAYEAGRVLPPVDKIIQICMLFNITVMSVIRLVAPEDLPESSLPADMQLEASFYNGVSFVTYTPDGTKLINTEEPSNQYIRLQHYFNRLSPTNKKNLADIAQVLSNNEIKNRF